MQEGSLSLIQMAKSFAAAIDRVSPPVFLSQDHTSSPTQKCEDAGNSSNLLFPLSSSPLKQ